GLESMLKAQLKLGKCNMVPGTWIEDGVNCSVPIATPDFYPMVADGRIKAIRGTFDRYDGKSIVMSNGERVDTDIAVLAIGFKLAERPAAGVYGGLCVAPYHYRHFDELLADIGAIRRRRNALAEMFTPPDADAYALFLASAPQYKAVSELASGTGTQSINAPA